METPGGEGKACVVDKALEDWLMAENLIVEDETGTLVLKSLVDDTRGRKPIVRRE